MALAVPAHDGDVNLYNFSGAVDPNSRIYFVNGMQVTPRDHAVTAAYLSLLTERPVWGIYNATAGVDKRGFAADVVQCAADYLQNATARLSSFLNLNKPSTISEDKIPGFLADLEKKYTIWNKATPALFRELVKNRHADQKIIAHSQGNLITSNALFVMEDVFGSAILEKIRVYSLASPSPAWPLGLRTTNGGGGRQDNAFMNDLVALLRPHNLAAKLGVGAFQNAGDFRTLESAGAVSLAPHDTNVNIATLNFLKSLRGDLGLSKDFTPEFLEEKAAIAKTAIAE